MNRYLLVEGDCRKTLLYIKPESIQQIVTSPPYYMMAKYGNLHGEIGTKGTKEQYLKDLKEVFSQCYRVLKPKGTFMLNIDNAKREDGFITLSAWEIMPLLKEVGFKLTQTIMWTDHTRRTIYHPKILNHYYEPIFILAKTSNYVFNWRNIDNKGDVWEIAGCYYFGQNKKLEKQGDMWDKSGIATFPVKLATQLITLGSNLNDTTLDPFAGSGTVMDASQRLHRNSIALEINSAYCEKIMERCFTKDNRYRYITQGQLERQQAKL